MKKFVFILLGIIALLAVAMFAIGQKYHYEQSIIINAPVEKVWKNVDNLKSFNQWNPWMKIDPSMKINYSGNSGEIGDAYSWDSENNEAGAGKQSIIEISPMKYLKTEMNFVRPIEGYASSKITLEPEGKSTKVTWDMDTEMKYPMNFMKLFMDGNMKKSYTDGLNSLKKLSEH